MSEYGNESLAGRVERLEREAKEVRDELRHVNTKRDRALPDSGQGEAEAEDSAVSSSASEDFLVIEKSAPRSSETDQPEVRRDHSSGEPGGRSFGVPFALGNLGDLRSGEWWLNKIGVGLLLFGVAFLYLLSVERGWIGPQVRVGFGLAVGATLLAIGLRVYEDRRSFAQVLFGGAVGTFYITGFAAFQIYALVSYPLAFVFMVAVTLLAYVLSLRQDGASLALIGSLGGLGTPFILYNGSGTLGGLVLYTCLILAGAGAIYFYKGWISLLGVSFAGGWMVLLAGFAGSFSFLTGPSSENQRILQLGVTFAWLLFWLAPTIREALRSQNPAAWPLPAPGPLARWLFGENGGLLSSGAPAHPTCVATPLIALAFTQGIWSLQKETLGWIALAGAVFYALAALVLGRFEGRCGGVAYTQALLALLLLTLALVLVLEGNALLFALAAEAAVLHHVAHRLSDRVVSTVAHALFFIAAVWLGLRLASDVLPSIEGFLARPTGLAWLARELVSPLGARPAIFNVPALVDLAVIALAFGASLKVTPRSTVWVYRTLAHLAALAWLARELLPLPDGDTWALLSWALYAAGLYVLSRRLPEWGTVTGTHALCAVVALWLGARVIGGAVEPGSPEVAVFDLWGITDLAIIALLALAALVVPPLPPRRSVYAYRLAAYVSFLAWLWRELSVLPGGDAYVTIAWGLYAVGLFVVGLRLDRVALVRGGMATLFLVVGKLFLVDLAQVGTVWRVLLFLGFGGLFLALSYYLRSLWRPGADAAAPETTRKIERTCRQNKVGVQKIHPDDSRA